MVSPAGRGRTWASASDRARGRPAGRGAVGVEAAVVGADGAGGGAAWGGAPSPAVVGDAAGAGGAACAADTVVAGGGSTGAPRQARATTKSPIATAPAATP